MVGQVTSPSGWWLGVLVVLADGQSQGQKRSHDGVNSTPCSKYGVRRVGRRKLEKNKGSMALDFVIQSITDRSQHCRKTRSVMRQPGYLLMNSREQARTKINQVRNAASRTPSPLTIPPWHQEGEQDTIQPPLLDSITIPGHLLNARRPNAMQ